MEKHGRYPENYQSKPIKSSQSLKPSKHVTFLTDEDRLKSPVPPSKPSLLSYLCLITVLLLLHLWNLSLALLNHLVYRPWSFNSKDPPLARITFNQFQNKPVHLALLFAPFELGRRLNLTFNWKWQRESAQEIRARRLEEMSRDIARLVKWSQLLGIERLSLYDQDGVLRDQPQLLLTLLTAQNFSITASHAPSFDLSAPSFEMSSIPLTNVTPLKVTLLSPIDGKDHIVTVARSLGEAGRKGQIRPNEITIDSLQEKLFSSSIPDIELLIVLGGPHLRLYDFPPWQIRLSEIFHEPSLNLLAPAKLSFKTFLKALEAFNGSQQRHGR